MRKRRINRIHLLVVGILGILASVIFVSKRDWNTAKIFTLLRRPLAETLRFTSEGQGRRLGETEGSALVETKEKPIRFAVLSDVHSDTENLQKALNKINNDNIEFTIVTGDLTTLGKLSELQEVHQLLVENTRKYYVIPGNHDIYVGDKVGADYFSQVFGERYQVFTVQSSKLKVQSQVQNAKIGDDTVKFILIDNASPEGFDVRVSEGTEVSEVSKGGSQWSWIERETEECPEIMCLVFMHIPLNHPGSEHIMGEGNPEVAQQASELVELLVKNQVRQVFAGHLHYSSSYEIEELKTQIVGAVTEERNWQSPRFIEVEVNKDRIDIEEVEVD